MQLVKKNNLKKSDWGQIWLNLFFVIVCLCYIIPFILLISISFEGNTGAGFSLIPKEFSLDGYRMIFANPAKVIKAYGVTIFYSVTATIGSLIVMSLFAYTLSKRDYKYRNVLTFLLFFTTLFNGGLVPSYLVNANILHLNNTIWIYILPALMNAWNVIIIRTFFQGLPEELFEAARIEGAGEARIWLQIALPLSKPTLASVGFLGFIALWNNWMTSQVYIRNPDLYSLQYLLKNILDNEQALREMARSGMVSLATTGQMQNLEAMRFAMAIVAAGPACLIFPFFQKYFAKGMTLGSVKG